MHYLSSLPAPTPTEVRRQCQTGGIRDELRPGLLAEVQFGHLGRILLSVLPPSTGEAGKEPLAHLPMTLWPRPCRCSCCALLGTFLWLSLSVFKSQPQSSRKPSLMPADLSASLLILLTSPGRRQLVRRRAHLCEQGRLWLSILPVTLCDHGQVSASFRGSVSSSVNWEE